MFLYSRIMIKTRKHQNRLYLKFWRADYIKRLHLWIHKIERKTTGLAELSSVGIMENNLYQPEFSMQRQRTNK